MDAIMPKNANIRTLLMSLRIFFDHHAATPDIDISDRETKDSSFRTSELKIISSTLKCYQRLIQP